MERKIYHGNGYQIYTIPSKKFRYTMIEVVFHEDARMANLQENYFLNGMMVYSSLKYPTNREFNIACEDLYDVSFEANIDRIGNHLFNSFDVSFLNPKYIKDKEYVNHMIEFLFQAILHPNVNHQQFDDESFQVIHDRINNQIDSYKEDAGNTAYRNGMNHLFKDSLTGQRIVGTKETLKKITPSSLYNLYRQRMAKSEVSVLVIGNLDMDKVVDKIKDCFKVSKENKIDIPLYVKNPLVKMHTDSSIGRFQQTQVALFFHIDTLTEREENYVLPIYNVILSENPLISKLGKKLRTDHSLCYGYEYAELSEDSFGFIVIGLSKEHIDESVKCVNEAFAEMEQGDINDKDLVLAKKKFLENRKIKNDSLVIAINNFYYHEILKSPLYEEFVKEIPTVSKEELIKVAHKIKPMYQYVLEESHEKD